MVRFSSFGIVDQRDVREALSKLEQLQQNGHDSAMIAQEMVQTSEKSKSKAVN